MMVAVPTAGNDLNATVEQRFGRSPRYILVDTETWEFRVVDNPAAHQAGGAGVFAAQLVIDQGAEAVIAGDVGPKAFSVLERAGVKVYPRVTGTIRDALDLLGSSHFSETDAPTTQAGHGR